MRARTSRGSNPILMHPQFLVVACLALKAAALYLPKRPPTGPPNPQYVHQHQTSPSLLYPVPANPLPPFPFPHPLLLVNYPRRRRCNFHRNFCPIYMMEYCWIPHQKPQSYRKPMVLRNAFHALLYPTSRFSRPFISKLYVGLFACRYRSSRQSTHRFLVSLGATWTCPCTYFFRLRLFHQIVETEPWYVSRLRSLCRINKLGLYFGTEKWEALLRGDVSNNVVDRYFVHGFQAIGMHLCGPPGESPVIVQLQARYAQMAWESLVKVYGTDDQKLEAQALLLLIHAFVIMGFTTPAQLYLLKMCKAINKANLQFLPVHGRPGELSEQVREDTVILSQAIYLENYFYLTLGGSAPTMTTRIEREFRLDLQVRITR